MVSSDLRHGRRPGKRRSLEMSEWQREIDLLRNDVNRQLDRVDASMQRCVTETYYAQSQTEMGRRIEALNVEIAALKEDRKTTALERDRDRAQMKVAFVGAGLTIIGTVGIELLRIVGHGP